MKTLIKKLSSRKFLTCVAGVVLGICITFGLDEGTVSTIAGAVTAIASVISYIVAEGKIDKAAVGDAANKVTESINAVEKIED